MPTSSILQDWNQRQNTPNYPSYVNLTNQPKSFSSFTPPSNHPEEHMNKSISYPTILHLKIPITIQALIYLSTTLKTTIEKKKDSKDLAELVGLREITPKIVDF